MIDTEATTESVNFRDSEYYIDRELSWLEFNGRVIEEAEDETTPLLERLKFLGIAGSNMDEFFMVRVSGIQEQVQLNVRAKNPAGSTPAEQFQLVHERAHEQKKRLYRCLSGQVLPKLAEENIFLRKMNELTREQKDFVGEYFDQQVFPVLTPLAVDSGHPFPHLRNLSLNLAVRLDAPPSSMSSNPLFAVMQVPSVLDRFIRLPGEQDKYEFMLLEDVIADEIHLIFPGMKVREVCAFRVTRDADIEFAEEEADDLLKTIEEELRLRERGSAVRMEIEHKASRALVTLLRETIGLDEIQTYWIEGPISLSDVAGIQGAVDRPDLKCPPFVPALREPLRTKKHIFSAVRQQDILLHHPYEAFTPVSDFIRQAADDPNVLAIKQTLYRTSGDSDVVKALMRAAENGKQVAALMELKARFDEERNINWAKQMEKAGVHVVYGLVGLKTHAKVCLVVRKEPGGIGRYVHLGTGNYNPITARLYTDMGLLTCDPDLCDDASELFNLLTGYSRMPQWRKIIVAPTHMREFFIKLIDEEIEKSKEGGPQGLIRAKMNSLVDQGIIEKLYEASCKGVKIQLLVRGICCLRPGIKGVSENIEVASIVGRFLEHSRIFIFGKHEEKKVYLSSADWMPRNLDRRVETLFPIEAPELNNRVVKEVWNTCWAGNVKRRVLQSDGTYRRTRPEEGAELVNAQEKLLEIEAGIRQESERGVTPEMLVTASNPPTAQANTTPIRPAMPAARHLKFARDWSPEEEERFETDLPPLLGEHRHGSPEQGDKG